VLNNGFLKKKYGEIKDCRGKEGFVLRDCIKIVVLDNAFADGKVEKN